MKHLHIAVFGLLTIFPVNVLCQNVRVGLDLMPIAYLESISIDIEYGFSINWSAGGRVEIDITGLKRKIGDEESEHRTELEEYEDDYGSNITRDMKGTSIYAQYWPLGIFYGPSICLGGSIRHGYEADAVIGIGYSCKVWKDVGAGIAFRIRAIETLKSQTIRMDSLQISLHYAF